MLPKIHSHFQWEFDTGKLHVNTLS